MPVETADLHLAAIQIEAVLKEHGLTEAYGIDKLINRLFQNQLSLNLVKIRIFNVPELNTFNLILKGHARRTNFSLAKLLPLARSFAAIYVLLKANILHKFRILWHL